MGDDHLVVLHVNSRYVRCTCDFKDSKSLKSKDAKKEQLLKTYKE